MCTPSKSKDNGDFKYPTGSSLLKIVWFKAE